MTSPTAGLSPWQTKCLHRAVGKGERGPGKPKRRIGPNKVTGW